MPIDLVFGIAKRNICRILHSLHHYTSVIIDATMKFILYTGIVCPSLLLLQHALAGPLQKRQDVAWDGILPGDPDPNSLPPSNTPPAPPVISTSKPPPVSSSTKITISSSSSTRITSRASSTASAGFTSSQSFNSSMRYTTAYSSSSSSTKTSSSTTATSSSQTGWQGATCTDPGVLDPSMDQSKRWDLVNTEDAWNAAIAKWKSNHGNGLSFTQAISAFFTGPEQMQCGSTSARDGCSSYVECKNINYPGGMYILNSFVSISDVSKL